MIEDTGRNIKVSGRRRIPNLSTLNIVFLIVLVFIILSVSTKTFFSYSNIYSLFFGVSIQFFALIGFTFLMIMGEIDLSVGAVYGFSGVLLGIFVVNLKLPFILALFLTLAVASLLGFINGFLVVRFRLNSIIVTLGMLSVLKGFTSIFTTALGSRTFPLVYRNLIKFKIFGIHWSILVFITVVIVLEILLYRTSIFRQMYYIGHNINTANLYGIKTDKIKIIVFLVSASTAAIGGILATSRIAYAYPTTGLGLEFTMVTAAVLGGASLYGGKGSILKSTLGLLLLAIIQYGMVIFAIHPYYQQVLLGAILIIAVYVDTRMNIVRS